MSSWVEVPRGFPREHRSDQPASLDIPVSHPVELLSLLQSIGGHYEAQPHLTDREVAYSRAIRQQRISVRFTAAHEGVGISKSLQNLQVGS